LKSYQQQCLTSSFKSSGPQIALFSHFREQWKLIDTAQHAAINVPVAKLDLTSSEKAWLCERKEDIINFLQNYSSQETQPRQDYLEFINLALIMLGSVNSTSAAGNNDHPVPVHFTPPGAYHHARWMAKGIYCLKIYLFHEQFKLTTQEVAALWRICLFTVTIYVKAWFSATSSCDAPWNDLCLLQK
jgi:hypothetical protein